MEYCEYVCAHNKGGADMRQPHFRQKKDGIAAGDPEISQLTKKG
jgi:hypothetical protein